MKKKKEGVGFSDDCIDFCVEWKLNTQEIEAKKKEHLENLDKIDDLLLKKKQMSDDFKAKIKQLDIKNYKLRATIKKESELRTVSCRVRYDYKENTRTVYHPQTDEVIDKRELTFDEKQMEF